MPNPTPASIRANADAAEIVRRILRTNATNRSIAAEYGCTSPVISRIVMAATTSAQRERARVRKIKRSKIGLPGHPAWNKGMKGIHLSPATQFKPGHRRAGAAKKYRSIGTVTTRSNTAGAFVRWIKVCETGPSPNRWMQFSRWVWMQQHGPIPEGHRVVHEDGDTMNDAPANLICVTGGDALFIAEQRDPAIATRRIRNAIKARRKRAVEERAIAAARKERTAA